MSFIEKFFPKPNPNEPIFGKDTDILGKNKKWSAEDLARGEAELEKLSVDQAMPFLGAAARKDEAAFD